MKTQTQIEEAINRLKENKLKTNQFSTFGDNNHRVLECMIITLENGYTKDDLDFIFLGNSDYDAAYAILDWKESDTEVLEDYLYSEN
jgi:hypothetical protein